MSQPEQATVPRPRLLAVDDEPANLRAFNRHFGKMFDVQTAESAQDALALAAKYEPELVVTDFAMPGTNGVDLARELRRRMPNVVIVMVTAFPDLPDVIRAHREKLISALVVKPWSRDDLLETLTQQVRLQVMSRDVAQLTGKMSGTL